MTIIGDFFKKIYYGNYILYSKTAPQYNHEYDALIAFSSFLSFYSLGLISLIFSLLNLLIIGVLLGAIASASILPILGKKCVIQGW